MRWTGFSLLSSSRRPSPTRWRACAVRARRRASPPAADVAPYPRLAGRYRGRARAFGVRHRPPIGRRRSACARPRPSFRRAATPSARGAADERTAVVLHSSENASRGSTMTSPHGGRGDVQAGRRRPPPPHPFPAVARGGRSCTSAATFDQRRARGAALRNAAISGGVEAVLAYGRVGTDCAACARTHRLRSQAAIHGARERWHVTPRCEAFPGAAVRATARSRWPTSAQRFACCASQVLARRPPVRFELISALSLRCRASI